MSRNPYTTLGVSKNASLEEIKVAYRTLALKYHPDRNPDDTKAEEKFKEISAAYAILRDPQQREQFDRYGSRGSYAPSSTSSTPYANVDWQSIFREADVHIDWNGRSGSVPQTGNMVFDFLSDAVTNAMRTSGLLPGEDRQLVLDVSVAEARYGATRRVHIPGPSMSPNGNSIVRTGSEVDVRVPVGVEEGSKLRLKGLGGPGNPPGDCYVTINLVLPSNVERKENDFYTDVMITPLEAENGTHVEILGMNVHIPSNAVDNEIVQVDGGGLRGGNLYVTVHIGKLRGWWRKIKNAVNF